MLPSKEVSRSARGPAGEMKAAVTLLRPAPASEGVVVGEAGRATEQQGAGEGALWADDDFVFVSLGASDGAGAGADLRAAAQSPTQLLLSHTPGASLSTQAPPSSGDLTLTPRAGPSPPSSAASLLSLHLPASLEASAPEEVERHIQELHKDSGMRLQECMRETEDLHASQVVGMLHRADAQVRKAQKELTKLQEQKQAQAQEQEQCEHSTSSELSVPPFAVLPPSSSSSASSSSADLSYSALTASGGSLLPTQSTGVGTCSHPNSNSPTSASTPAVDALFASAMSLYVHACMLLYPFLFTRMAELLRQVVAADAKIASTYNHSHELPAKLLVNPHRVTIGNFAEVRHATNCCSLVSNFTTILFCVFADTFGPLPGHPCARQPLPGAPGPGPCHLQPVSRAATGRSQSQSQPQLLSRAGG